MLVGAGLVFFCLLYRYDNEFTAPQFLAAAPFHHGHWFLSPHQALHPVTSALAAVAIWGLANLLSGVLYLRARWPEQRVVQLISAAAFDVTVAGLAIQGPIFAVTVLARIYVAVAAQVLPSFDVPTRIVAISDIAPPQLLRSGAYVAISLVGLWYLSSSHQRRRDTLALATSIADENWAHLHTLKGRIDDIENLLTDAGREPDTVLILDKVRLAQAKLGRSMQSSAPRSANSEELSALVRMVLPRAGEIDRWTLNDAGAGIAALAQSDREYLDSFVNDLVRNTSQAGAESPGLTLQIDDDPGRVTLEVRCDCGKSDPFRETRSHAVLRRRVERLGGDMTVEPGSVHTVQLRWPREPASN